MTSIAILADELSTYTSAGPIRQMLPHLLSKRAEIEFIFVLCRGSKENAWWKAFRSGISFIPNWTERILPYSRRTYNILTLIGFQYFPRVEINADLYLRFDVGTMGPKSSPLVNMVADISVLRTPAGSSLKWHGRRIFRRQLREGVRLSTATVCISRFTASDLAAWVPELAPRIHVIPYWISSEWIEQESADTSLHHAQRDAPYFVWYGFITPRKNIEGLLSGYARAVKACDAPDSFPNLLLIGNARDGEELLSRMISGLGLSERVRRLPSQTTHELVPLISASRGLAFPSFYEGFGLPIIEAFARGIPVLTSNVTSMPEVAGDLADLCDPHDPDSIAKGLLAMALDNRWSDDWVARRKAYASRFTAERAAEAYSQLIDEVLAEQGKPGS